MCKRAESDGKPNRSSGGFPLQTLAISGLCVSRIWEQAGPGKEVAPANAHKDQICKGTGPGRPQRLPVCTRVGPEVRAGRGS